MSTRELTPEQQAEATRLWERAELERLATAGAAITAEMTKVRERFEAEHSRLAARRSEVWREAIAHGAKPARLAKVAGVAHGQVERALRRYPSDGGTA